MTCAHVIALMTTHSGSIPPFDLHIAVPSRKSTTFSRACLKQGPRESERDEGRGGEGRGLELQRCHQPPQQLVMGRSEEYGVLQRPDTPHITADFHQTHRVFPVFTVEKKHTSNNKYTEQQVN